MNMKHPSSDWYKKIWTLGIKNMSWTEKTGEQVDFIENALGLTRSERILDIACGYGRHSLELARRGYDVVGVDITKDYIDDAIKTAKEENLNVEFLLGDARDIDYTEEFDVTLNLGDGAIGYLENDTENHKIFEGIARALKVGGMSLIDICSQEHALMHFPKKYWEIGESQISLPCFEYDEKTKRMLYGGFVIDFGKIAEPPESISAHSSTRLYSYDEVTEIFGELGLETQAKYGQYTMDIPHTHKNMQMLIVSKKVCHKD